MAIYVVHRNNLEHAKNSNQFHAVFVEAADEEAALAAARDAAKQQSGETKVRDEWVASPLDEIGLPLLVRGDVIGVSGR